MDINIEQTQTILKIYAFILVIFLEILIPTIEEALNNNQIQPVLKEYKKELKK